MDDDERKDIRAGRAERWQDSMRDELPVPYYLRAELWRDAELWRRADGTPNGPYTRQELNAKHGRHGWTEVDLPEEDNG